MMQNTYLIPKQLLGPLEKDTRYFSRSLLFFCNHLEGSKVLGFGNISGFLCKIVAPIETTVYWTNIKSTFFRTVIFLLPQQELWLH